MENKYKQSNILKRFLRSIPKDIPKPELARDPDGDISVDWILSKNHIVSVGISDNERLPSAWIIENESGHLVVEFNNNTFPDEIYTLIKKSMQSIEDITDSQIANEAYQELIETKNSAITTEELKKDLNL